MIECQNEINNYFLHGIQSNWGMYIIKNKIFLIVAHSVVPKVKKEKEINK